VHSLAVNEHTPYQVYARDSNFMTPYAAVCLDTTSNFVPA